jgi:hypothetical protein
MTPNLLKIAIIIVIIIVLAVFAIYKINLRDSVGVYKDFVVTEALALEIGKAVLKHICGEEIFYENTLTVKEVKKFFVVSFTQEGYALGGDFNVAINKKDGKILKIWAGE